jgi:hypothetical protein
MGTGCPIWPRRTLCLKIDPSDTNTNTETLYHFLDTC